MNYGDIDKIKELCTRYRGVNTEQATMHFFCELCIISVDNRFAFVDSYESAESFLLANGIIKFSDQEDANKWQN